MSMYHTDMYEERTVKSMPFHNKKKERIGKKSFSKISLLDLF